eukprot:scaffold9079_cov127-Isochrysis_galbana.AAC.2
MSALASTSLRADYGRAFVFVLGWGLAFALLRRDGMGRVTAIGMLSVFDPRLRRQAQSGDGVLSATGGCAEAV